MKKGKEIRMEKKKKTTARKIIGDILLLLTGLLSLDVVLVMVHKINTVVLKNTYTKILGYELILLAVLILFALDFRFSVFTIIKNKIAQVIGWVLRIAVILFNVFILFFICQVIFGSFYYSSAPASHVVVLGMALEDGKPTQDLLKRIETAENYLKKNPDAILILTGGNPGPDGRTEARVMHDLMLTDGVPEECMILEDEATTTKENFTNTIGLIGNPDEPIVLISSNYHMQRAVNDAKKAGFNNVLRQPAPSQFLTYGSNMMWEVILDIRAIGK